MLAWKDMLDTAHLRVAGQIDVVAREGDATAVAEYLAKHRGEDVTARLNDVFADHPSGVDPAVRSAQARSIGRSEW